MKRVQYLFLFSAIIVFVFGTSNNVSAAEKGVETNKTIESFTLPEQNSKYVIPFTVSQNTTINFTISGETDLFEAHVSFGIYDTLNIEDNQPLDDWGVTLYRPNGTLRKVSYSYFAEADSTYYLVIFNSKFKNPYAYKNVNGNYNLFVEYNLSKGDSNEPNNNFDVATPVIKDKKMNFTLSGINDIDFFKVNVDSTKTPLEITIGSKNETFNSYVSYAIYKDEADGYKLIDDWGVSNRALHAFNSTTSKSFKLVDKGTYYIKVMNSSFINYGYLSNTRPPDNQSELYLKCNYGSKEAESKELNKLRKFDEFNNKVKKVSNKSMNQYTKTDSWFMSLNSMLNGEGVDTVIYRLLNKKDDKSIIDDNTFKFVAEYSKVNNMDSFMKGIENLEDYADSYSQTKNIASLLDNSSFIKDIVKTSGNVESYLDVKRTLRAYDKVLGKVFSGNVTETVKYVITTAEMHNLRSHSFDELVKIKTNYEDLNLSLKRTQKKIKNMKFDESMILLAEKNSRQYIKDVYGAKLIDKHPALLAAKCVGYIIENKYYKGTGYKDYISMGHFISFNLSYNKELLKYRNGTSKLNAKMVKQVYLAYYTSLKLSLEKQYDCAKTVKLKDEIKSLQKEMKKYSPETFLTEDMCKAIIGE